MASDDSADMPRGAVRGPVYMMYPQDSGARVDLVELLLLLWHRKWLIACFVAGAVIIGGLYAFLAEEVYRVDVVLVPNEPDPAAGLPSGIGALAGIAGLNIGSSTQSTEATAVLRSHAFVEDFIVDEDLLPVLFADEWDAVEGRWKEASPDEQPNVQDGVEYFVDEVRTVSTDVSANLVTLAIEWNDAEAAREWAEKLVYRINERLRERDLDNSRRRLSYLNTQLDNANLVELRQAIGRLIEREVQNIMVAQADVEYAFEVIDPPRVPTEPVAPNKLLILVLSALLGCIAGATAVIIRSWQSGVDHD